MAQTRTLAFEIGVEEIPAFDLVDAVKQLERKVPALLDDARIPHGAIEVYDSRVVLSSWSTMSLLRRLQKQRSSKALPCASPSMKRARPRKLQKVLRVAKGLR